MWRRAILALAICAAVPTVGLAASIVLPSAGLGAGSASSPRCASVAPTVIQNLSGSSVISVSVGSLASGCGGATVYVTVNNGTVSGSGSAVVPAGGGSVTVTLGSAPAASVSEQTDVVLLGP